MVSIFKNPRCFYIRYLELKEEVRLFQKKLLLSGKGNKFAGKRLGEFEQFEKLLLKHPRLCDYVNINDENVLFTFDFSDLGDDWDCFINGKYSIMSMSVKRKIIDFFDKSSGNYIYIESFLYPHKWFDKYSELLNIDVNILKAVGELCDKPNLETLSEATTSPPTQTISVINKLTISLLCNA